MKYTIERGTLVLLALLKKHGIRRIIVNPGTQNMGLVISAQQDDWFELYSCVDERSGAYMACGMAEGSGEPVAITCTGATASRNYLPAITEAYYRKLQIIAITATKEECFVGNNFAQVIDRSTQPCDTYKSSVHIPLIKNDNDEWKANTRINEALLKMREGAGGPVHINLETVATSSFTVDHLPDVRAIKYISTDDCLPIISGRQIVIFVGNHKRWEQDLLEMVERFCELFDAVVVQDLTGKYTGKYGVFVNLIAEQECYESNLLDVDLCIYIGNVSAMDAIVRPKEVWRVSADNEISDVFCMKTTYLIGMQEYDFFKKCCEQTPSEREMGYYKKWQTEYRDLITRIPELPLSTGYIAKNAIKMINDDCSVYLGIYNCLRNFNYFGGEARKKVCFYANTGGFGIDGGCSTIVGMALANPKHTCYAFVGDLGFFYDMNSIGNKHIRSNIRIMVINNGTGMEMELYSSGVTKTERDTGHFCSAKGHFGKKSRDVIKHYAEDMGFDYLAAEDKDSFLQQIKRFTNPSYAKKPILMEVFTNPESENESLKLIRNLRVDMKNGIKQSLKGLLTEKQKNVIKHIIGKR